MPDRNKPQTPMPARALDHPQIAVSDLDLAAEAYRRMGFTLAPRMTHSFGTSNHLIMVGQEYLELIGGFSRIQDVELRNMMSPAGGHEGLLSLALFSEDIPADMADYAARGAVTPTARTFSRPVPLPGGGEATLSFTGCGIVNTAAPRMQIFACHQHNPDLVWKPEWMTHANGAHCVAAVVYVADDPSRHAAYLELMVGQGSVREVGGMLQVDTGRAGRIEVITPAMLDRRFPAGAAQRHEDIGDHGVGVRVRVVDLTRSAAVLRAAGVPFFEAPGALTVPAANACGVVLEFVQ